MLGDVLLINDRQRAVANLLAEEILRNRRPKCIVAISGESGSGKSELAHLIAKAIFKQGVVAKIIHTDNFYKTLPLERAGIRKKGGVSKTVGIHEYDWEKIHQVIDDFQNGVQSTMPCVDLVTQRVDQLITDFAPVEVLVMDGLYAIHADAVGLSIFIELSYHETKKAQAGRGKESLDDFRYQVLEAEHHAVQSLKSRAGWLINKEYQLVKAARAARKD